MDADIKRVRPHKLASFTYQLNVPLNGEHAYLIISEDERGEPFEVFLNVGKGGSDVQAFAEALGRAASLILRMPSPLSPRERLTELADQWSGIGGSHRVGLGPNRVDSVPDGIAQTLLLYLNGNSGAGEDK